MLGNELASREKDALVRLYDNFQYEINKSKVIKRYDPSSIIYELLTVTKNNRSSILTNISVTLTDDVSTNLENLGLLQSLDVQGIKKWTITLQGLSYIISAYDSLSFFDQFSNLLRCYDSKFKLDSKKQLEWKEKLVTLSLILMVSTSKTSAIVLDNSSNRTLFEELLSRTLSCLNRHNIFEKKRKLPKSKGGEPMATLIVRSGISDLPAKTNDIYVNLGGGEGYYLDIEQSLELDKEKMWFLMNLIFEHYDTSVNYDELKTELINISEQYSTQMMTRNVNSRILFDILNKIDEYFNIEINELPYRG